MSKEDGPVMKIVSESDKDDKNKTVQVNNQMQKIGKKIAPSDAKPSDVCGIAADRLRSLIERIERIEEKKKAISSDISDIYCEAKGDGFDPKIMRAIIKLRKMNASDRDEQEILIETYRRALDV